MLPDPYGLLPQDFDPELSAPLRRYLRLIRQQAMRDGTATGDSVDTEMREWLASGRPARALLGVEAYRQRIEHRAQQMVDRWHESSPQERERAVQEGNALIARTLAEADEER